MALVRHASSRLTTIESVCLIRATRKHTDSQLFFYQHGGVTWRQMFRYSFIPSRLPNQSKLGDYITTFPTVSMSRTPHLYSEKTLFVPRSRRGWSCIGTRVGQWWLCHRPASHRKPGGVPQWRSQDYTSTLPQYNLPCRDATTALHGAHRMIDATDPHRTRSPPPRRKRIIRHPHVITTTMPILLAASSLWTLLARVLLACNTPDSSNS